MKLSEIILYINGRILNPSVYADGEVVGGCGADLMSDVLTRAKPGAVLLTGLCNLQVVRTAEMADARAVVFLRGKRPAPEVIELSTQRNIVAVSCEMGMFEACGRLYNAGLPSFESTWNGFHE